MAKVTLEAFGREEKWDVPEEVGLQLFQTFTQVLGPAKEDANPHNEGGV